MTNKASIVTDGWSGRRNINAQAQDDKIGEAMAAEHQHQSNRKFRLGKYLYRYVYIDTYFVGIVVVVVVVFVIEHGFRYCVCQYRIAHVLRSWRENVVLTPQFISVSSFKSFAWENYFLLPLSFCLTSTHRGAINRGCVSVYFHFAKMYTEQKGNIFPSLLLMAFGSPDSLFCFLVQTHLKMSFLIRREQHSNQLWKKNSRKNVYVFLFHPLQLTYFFLFAFLSSTLIK